MTRSIHGMSRFDIFMKSCVDGEAPAARPPLEQHFGYLLPNSKTNANTGPNELTGKGLTFEKIATAFEELVDTMRDENNLNGPADAGMTFLAQFVDHDITLEATSMIGKKIDPASIRNVRTPGLDLDCVYGDGPEASPHLYSPQHEGFLLFGREDHHYDLARNCKGTALIGDPRNDENILVSQIQGAFITLHNILMGSVNEGGEAQKAIHDCGNAIPKHVWMNAVKPELENFEQVRLFLRLHYQHAILHEMLPAFIDQECIDAALEHDIFGPDAPIMPVEFSVAAFRFGHATVQQEYKLTKTGNPVPLFAGMRGFSKRTKADDIEMRMFFDVAGTVAQKARPVGPKMATELFALPEPIVTKGETFGDFGISKESAKKLGLRNILRDRGAIRCASGQQLARWLAANHPALGVKELPAPATLKKHHITKTPLWFYCLEEATKSKKLTGVGGIIVASVFARLLKLDRESILHTEFEPWSGFGEKFTMGNMMKWMEDHRDHVTHAADLRCG